MKIKDAIKKLEDLRNGGCTDVMMAVYSKEDVLNELAGHEPLTEDEIADVIENVEENMTYSDLFYDAFVHEVHRRARELVESRNPA